MAELPTGTVTFLFTDIEGSVALWEQEPDAMRQALLRHDTLIEQIVAEHEGHVVRPRGEGDSRFAVFSRALDGLAATAALQQALHAEPWPTPTPLRVRMAVHTGEADLRAADYYGSAVNRCARLRAAAHGGQTVLSLSTQQLVCDRLPSGVILRDLGEYRLRDLNRPKRIFQLDVAGIPVDFPPLHVRSSPSAMAAAGRAGPLGAAGGSVRQDPASAGLSADAGARVPLVGRQRELDQLRTVWQMVEVGHPQMVVLVGEAGIGKTRLAEEVLRWAEEQGVAIATAHCYASGGRLAYAPVADWLRARPLRPLDPLWLTEVGRVVPEVLVHQPDIPRPGAMDEAWQRQRLFEALVSALLGEHQQLILLLDDIQWCDQETIDWLHFLLHISVRARLLVVGTLRVEDQPANASLATLLGTLKRDRQVTTIDVERLDAPTTTTLVAALSDDAFAEAVSPALYRETEGNPLFIVEMVRATQERSPASEGVIGAGDKHLEHTDSYLLSLPRAHGPERASDLRRPLPSTVQAVIAQRLAQLTPAARELCELAAAIGRVFSIDLMMRVGGEQDSLVQGLDELVQRRIAREQAEGRYDFSHDKLREVAYGDISTVRRRVLHRRIAQALESLSADAFPVETEHQTTHADLSSPSAMTINYPELAFHWSQAGDEMKTIVYLALAGEQAFHSGAYWEAVTLFSNALARAPHAATPTDQVRRAQWEQQMGASYYGLGDLIKGREYLERAVEVLDRPVPATSAGLLLAALSQFAGHMFYRLLPASRNAARTRLLALSSAYERLGEIWYIHNEGLKLLYVYIRCYNLSERLGPSVELARACAGMSAVVALASLPGLARRYIRRARKLAGSVQDAAGEAWVELIAGMNGLYIGQWAEAEDALERACAIYANLSDHRREAESLGRLAQVATRQGQYERAETLRAELVRKNHRRGDIQFQIVGLLNEVEISLLLHGRLDEAMERMQMVAGLREQYTALGEEIWYYGLLARVHLYRGEAQQAQEAAEQASRLMSQTRPVVVYAFAGYSSAAEVPLRLWEQRAKEAAIVDDVVANLAQRCCNDFHQYARVFPIGQPRALLYQGLYAWLDGKPGRAKQAWTDSLGVASRLRMPYEQGLAHHELGRHLPGDERQNHLDQAHEIFARLGASYDLSRMDAERRLA